MVYSSMKDDDRCVLILRSEDDINEVCIIRDGDAYIGILSAGYRSGEQTRDFNTLGEITSFFKQFGYTKEV